MVSGGDHQEKRAEVLLTAGKEISVGKCYDRRKGGRQQRKKETKKTMGRRLEAMEWMKHGRIEKSSVWVGSSGGGLCIIGCAHSLRSDGQGEEE